METSPLRNENGQLILVQIGTQTFYLTKYCNVNIKSLNNMLKDKRFDMKLLRESE